jgi:electron transport complex protein RnfG
LARGNDQIAQESLLKELVPEASAFSESTVDDINYFQAFDKEGKVTYIIFKTEAEGYAGPIETIAVMDPEGRLLAVKILSQHETEGRGDKILEPSFIGRFNAISVYDLEKVNVISGATISSKAVIESVKKAGIGLISRLKK